MLCLVNRVAVLNDFFYQTEGSIIYFFMTRFIIMYILSVLQLFFIFL
jgi:hypothetical protein